MRNVGLQFRATKDLDIVLCLEVFDRAFAEAFWRFVEAGQYQINQTATGQKRFYRFLKPANEPYPVILELFSRVPGALSIEEGSHLTPISVDGDVSSLSAILLDAGYYDWIQSGNQVVEGVPIVGPEHLVPLKAKAWLDLCARRDAGEAVDSKSIRKHKNDVFRLFQVIDPERAVEPPTPIGSDIGSFLSHMATEQVDLKALGLGSIALESVLNGFRKLYRIE